MMSDIFDLDIIMVCYNQEKFIAQAIESVLEQQTEYKYRLLIFDDHSEDGTHEICKKYAEDFPRKIHLMRNQKNLGLIRNYAHAFKKVESKYIAILEGDDFWCDPKKITKQIEVLEKTDEVGIVHTGFNVLDDSGNLRRAHLGKNKDFLSGSRYLDYLEGKTTISPHTVVFRSELFKEHVNLEFCVEKEFWTVDMFIWPHLLYFSEIHYLPDITSVYRIHSMGLSNIFTLDKAYKRMSDLRDLLSYLEKSFQSVKIDGEKLMSRQFNHLIEKMVASKNFNDALVFWKANTHFSFLIPKILASFNANPLFYYRTKSAVMVFLSSFKQKIFKAVS